MLNVLVYCETEEAYAHNLKQLTETMVDFLGAITYLHKHWLTRHKELFVVAWTKEYLHFDNHTTSKVDSQHAKLKLYLDSSQSDLKCGDVEIYEKYRCQLRISNVFVYMYLYTRQPLPLNVVNSFWKKLDFSPCISLSDNLDCEAELEELNAEFNKQFGLPIYHQQLWYKISKLVEIVDFERQLAGSAFMKMNGPPSDIIYCKSWTCTVNIVSACLASMDTIMLEIA
nr:hypothetical protein [Tanacetum cinerariifolium]